MSNWHEEFKGRCVACAHSRPTARKQELMCTNEKAARNHGLPSRPGGTWHGTPVHKLFGCIYFKPFYSPSDTDETN